MSGQKQSQGGGESRSLTLSEAMAHIGFSPEEIQRLVSRSESDELKEEAMPRKGGNDE